MIPINIKKSTTLLLVCLLISCSKDGAETTPIIDIIPPVATTLLFPHDNEPCKEGKSISEDKSQITFEWNTSEHTDNYILQVKNLKSGSTTENSAGNKTSLTLTLEKGAPYSWFVISEANGLEEKKQSEVWKFYNAGDGVENYAPFPAEAVSPKIGATVETAVTNINLSWNGSDLDNDLKEFSIYFDTVSPPQKLAGTKADNFINVNIEAGKNLTYYWKIVSRDYKNNTSESEIFQFKVK